MRRCYVRFESPTGELSVAQASCVLMDCEPDGECGGERFRSEVLQNVKRSQGLACLVFPKHLKATTAVCT